MHRLIDAMLLFLVVATSAQAAEIADTVYQNGKIYTVNEAQPWAEAVAIKDGKFIIVGSNTDAKAAIGSDTEVIELESKFVMPGMIDVHTHGIDASMPVIVELSDANNVDAILSEVKAYLDANPEQEWTLFNAFGFGLFPGDNGPKELLDEVAPDQAVVIYHQSGHAFWVNSKALELAGITKDTPDPHQGIIARKENGEPAGGLQETAMKLIWKVVPPYTKEATQASVRTMNKLFAANGITATREAGITPDRYAIVREMADDGLLTTRYSFAAHWRTTTTVLTPEPDQIRAFLFENVGKGDDVIRMDTLKVFLDGVPASHTALLKEPYSDRPDSKGWQLISAQELNAAIVDYDKNGVTAIFHVLGDQATSLALDAVAAARKANGDSGLRHHLSHSVIIDPADFPRYGDLGVVVDFSPFFAYPGPHHANHIKAVGAKRFEKWYPVKSIMDQGVPVAVATDYPVDQLNPFVHIESAHTRMHPLGTALGTLGAEEAISREDAIKSYTLNPAYILGWDQKIGSIEVGKLADMVILDQNPFEVDSAAISEIRVERTIFSGDVVYDATSDASILEKSEYLRMLAFTNLQASGHACAIHQ